MSTFPWGIFGSNTITQFSRIWLLRAFFFGVMVYDLIGITFKHAARYGVDGFNVSHLSVVDWALPVPSPMLIGTLWILCAFASVFAALNVYTAPAIRMVAAIYGGIYFWSQIDSYQHHYLNALIAFMLAVLPSRVWRAPKNNGAESLSSPLVGLIYVQFGLVYLWTAVAKLDSTWLSGATMMSIGHGDQLLVFTSYLSELVYGTSGDPSLAMDALYQTLSVLVIAGEALVALCYFCPRLRYVGLVLAPIFHLSVEFLGLDIELFSLYMIGINLILLSPDRLWESLDRWGNSSEDGQLTSWLNTLFGARHYRKHLILFASGTLAAFTLLNVPFNADQSSVLSMTLSLCVCLVTFVTWHSKPTTKGIISVSFALILASTLVSYLMDSTGAVYDYHRMLGGDLSRRLPARSNANFDDRLEEAITVYGIANASHTTVPARRDKQARLILRGIKPERFPRASGVLNEAYALHRDRINQLERQINQKISRTGLEELIKAQTSLGKICKTLSGIPTQPQSESKRTLALTITEMSKNSRGHLVQLTRLVRQDVRNGLGSVFSELEKNERYARSSDELVSTVNARPGPNCLTRLEQQARWGLLRAQMRLGRRDALQPELITRSRIDSEQCSAQFRYPVSGIIAARAQRTGLAKLTRNRRRVFDK